LSQGESTAVKDIDNHRHVVGSATIGGQTHAMIWTIG
jgi:hypothetical protein